MDHQTLFPFFWMPSAFLTISITNQLADIKASNFANVLGCARRFHEYHVACRHWDEFGIARTRHLTISTKHMQIISGWRPHNPQLIKLLDHKAFLGTFMPKPRLVFSTLFKTVSNQYCININWNPVPWKLASAISKKARAAPNKKYSALPEPFDGDFMHIDQGKNENQAVSTAKKLMRISFLEFSDILELIFFSHRTDSTRCSFSSFWQSRHTTQT